MEKPLVLFDIDYTLFDTAKYKESHLTKFGTYEEIEKALIEVVKTADLGILSEGEYDFQTTKLLQTDILKHFDHDRVHIVLDKLAELPEILKQYKDRTLYLVDDKLTVLHAAKQIRPELVTIWIKRGPYAEEMQSVMYNPDHEVETLEKIVDLIK